MNSKIIKRGQMEGLEIRRNEKAIKGEFGGPKRGQLRQALNEPVVKAVAPFSDQRANSPRRECCFTGGGDGRSVTFEFELIPK